MAKFSDFFSNFIFCSSFPVNNVLSLSPFPVYRYLFLSVNTFFFFFCTWRVYLNAARNSITSEYKAVLYCCCMTGVMLQGLTGNLPPSLKPWSYMYEKCYAGCADKLLYGEKKHIKVS